MDSRLFSRTSVPVPASLAWSRDGDETEPVPVVIRNLSLEGAMVSADAAALPDDVGTQLLLELYGRRTTADVLEVVADGDRTSVRLRFVGQGKEFTQFVHKVLVSAPDTELAERGPDPWRGSTV